MRRISMERSPGARKRKGSTEAKPPTREVQANLIWLKELLEAGRVTTMDYIVGRHRSAMRASTARPANDTSASRILPEEGVNMATHGSVKIGRDQYHTEINMYGHALVADEPRQRWSKTMAISIRPVTRAE
jgi:hypothetical protein